MRGVSSGGFGPHHPAERSYGRTLDCLSSRSGFDSRLGRPKVLRRAVQLTTRQLTIFDVWILKKTLRSVLWDLSKRGHLRCEHLLRQMATISLIAKWFHILKALKTGLKVSKHDVSLEKRYFVA